MARWVPEKVIRSKLKFKNEIEDDTSKSQSGLACIPAPYKKLRQTMPQKKAAEAVGVARTTAETWDTKLKNDASNDEFVFPCIQAPEPPLPDGRVTIPKAEWTRILVCMWPICGDIFSRRPSGRGSWSAQMPAKHKSR